MVHVLTLESQNDNYHEIHIKKNPICILNFLHEHVPTFYEKKNDIVPFIKKKLTVNLITLETTDHNFGAVLRL